MAKVSTSVIVQVNKASSDSGTTLVLEEIKKALNERFGPICTLVDSVEGRRIESQYYSIAGEFEPFRQGEEVADGIFEHRHHLFNTVDGGAKAFLWAYNHQILGVEQTLEKATEARRLHIKKQIEDVSKQTSTPKAEDPILCEVRAIRAFLEARHSGVKIDPLPTPSQDDCAAPTPGSGSDDGKTWHGSNLENLKSTQKIIDDAFDAKVKIMEDAARKETASAHSDPFPLATATLESFVQGFAANFKKHSLVKGSVLRGKYWVILGNGSFLPVEDYILQEWDNNSKYWPIYFAERDVDTDCEFQFERKSAARTYREFVPAVQNLYRTVDRTMTKPTGKVQVILRNGWIWTGDASGMSWLPNGEFTVNYWRPID